jgi:hypothetical protein
MNELSDIDGILCVRMKHIDYKEPFMVISDYPTELKTNEFKRNFEINSLNEILIVNSENFGIYTFCIKKVLCGQKWKLQLKDGEKTIPINFLKEPIPCPKVRTGTLTRWNEFKERWEKELKSGWCPA